MTPTRRDVLKLAAASTAGLGLSPDLAFAQAAPPARTPVPALATPVGKAAKPLRILILGGTGFTGPSQVRYALARGHKLTLLNRGRRPKEWPGEVEELVGDRNAPGGLDALKGREWDVCIDNPTTLPAWVRDAGQVLKGKVGQYVFISTLSVYAHERTVDADETEPVAEYKGADPMKETHGDPAREHRGALWIAEGVVREGSREVVPGHHHGDSAHPDRRPRRRHRPLHLLAGAAVARRRRARARRRHRRGAVYRRPRPGGVDRSAWSRRGPSACSTPRGPTTGRRCRRCCSASGRRRRRARGCTGCRRRSSASRRSRPGATCPCGCRRSPTRQGFSRRSVKRAVAAGLTFRPLAQTALDTLAWFSTLPADRQAKLRAGIAPEREKEVLAAWKAKKGQGR